MNILSQNDPRWKNTTLGTSNVTIGNYGCTITCIAMLLGTTPDVVNKRMVDVQGFAEGNLVIWSKIEEAFPGINVRRVWIYNNDDVKNNLPCMVEVDGKPIGGYRHWIVYTGNQRCYDPWDGHDDPTSDYPDPKSYCVLLGSWQKPITPTVEHTQENTQPMKQVISDVYRAIRGTEATEDEVNYRLKSGINTYDLTKDILYSDGLSSLVSLQHKNDELQNTILSLEKQIAILQSKPLVFPEPVEALKNGTESTPPVIPPPIAETPQPIEAKTNVINLLKELINGILKLIPKRKE